MLVGGLSEVLIVGGTLLAVATHPDGRPLDGIGYALLTAGAVSVALGLWQPVPALVLALAAMAIFHTLGYEASSPLFLAVIVLLFLGSSAHRVSQSVFVALLAVGFVVGQHVLTPGNAGLNATLLADTGWIAAAVLAGHAVAAHREYLAAMRERVRRAEESRELEAQRRVTEERLRIARELHDVVSHTISVINVQAGVAAHVTLNTSGEPARVSPSVELAAYRIVQESLTNALRYAHGGSAQVRLVYDVNGLVVEVSDSGRAGLEPVAGSGYGIQGMRERAVAVGGTLQVGPQSEGGFRVHASLPAQA